MSAADILRQAVEALPESERAERWPVIQPDAYPSVSLDPTATLALADLLDAIRGDKIDWRALHGDAASAAWKRHVFDARDFLEQAITREAS